MYYNLLYDYINKLILNYFKYYFKYNNITIGYQISSYFLIYKQIETKS